MNEFFRYGVRSHWRDRPESPAALGARFLQTLDDLSKLDPALFANWQLIDPRAADAVSLDGARAQTVSFVERNVSTDDGGEPDPDNGYWLVGRAGGYNNPRSMRFRAAVGGKHKSETGLELADFKVAPDLAIVIYPLFRAALLAINKQWSPDWACTYAFRMYYYQTPLHPGAPLFPYSIFHIPWLGYLSAPLAAGLKLAPEILTERTPDGGVLMIAAEQRLDPANPEHLRRARIIAETMMACTGEKPTTLEQFAQVRKVERDLEESFRRQIETGGGSGE